MASRKPKPTRIELDPLSREKLSRAAESFFADNWDEPVSDLRRRLFVEWLEDEAGHLFYNRAIQDALSASGVASSRLQEELDLLRRLE